MTTSRLRALLAVLLLAAAASAAASDMRADMAVMDSLHAIQPKLRLEWLRKRGMGDLLERTATPDLQGLHIRGKWGRGPAVEVTGRDSLVVLTLGSEVALIDFAQPDSPRVLSEIQFDALTNQSCLLDSLLIIGSNSGIEIWNVADPSQPVRRSQLPYPVGDFWARDTFLHFIRQDTFRVYSFADAANPRLLGWYRDSGYVTTGSGNTVIIGNGSSIFLADVSDPANPHRVGSYPVGGFLLSACARGNLCCISYEGNPDPVVFATLDISNPASVQSLGSIQGTGGYDIYLDSSLAFVSGRDQSEESFQIVSVADSVHPSVVGLFQTPKDYNWGVWACVRRGRAYVADRYEGLVVLNIAAPALPVLDTILLTAATAEDVYVDGIHCYVANGQAGLKVLDVTDPGQPFLVGSIDTTAVGAWSYSVVARDSFAYFGWNHPFFQTADVSVPSQPQVAGGCLTSTEPRDMVLRDSFVYAVINYQFDVINVARPRQPQVVGTCNLPERSWKLVLRDTLAYVANLTGLVTVDIARPDSPSIIGSWTGRVLGVALLDTFAYVASSNYGLKILSIADPANPRFLDSIPLDGWVDDVEVIGSTAYVGGWRLYALSLADPVHPQEVARWIPPSLSIRRLAYSTPYLYAACTEGGVSILDTVSVGIAEAQGEFATPSIVVAPTVTRGLIRFSGHHRNGESRITVLDVSGKEIACSKLMRGSSNEIDITGSPDGVYLVMVSSPQGAFTTKVVKTRR